MGNFVVSRTHKNILMASIIVNFFCVIASVVIRVSYYHNIIEAVSSSLSLIFLFILTTFSTILVMKSPQKGNIILGYVVALINLFIFNRVGPILMLVGFVLISSAKKQTQFQGVAAPVYTQQPTIEKTEEKNLFQKL